MGVRPASAFRYSAQRLVTFRNQLRVVCQRLIYFERNLSRILFFSLFQTVLEDSLVDDSLTIKEAPLGKGGDYAAAVEPVYLSTLFSETHLHLVPLIFSGPWTMFWPVATSRFRLL